MANDEQDRTGEMTDDELEDVAGGVAGLGDFTKPMPPGSGFVKHEVKVKLGELQPPAKATC